MLDKPFTWLIIFLVALILVALMLVVVGLVRRIK